MIEPAERERRVRTGAPPGRRRKVAIVTNSVPGRDAGFAKAGHVAYLESVIEHFLGRNFETMLVVMAPRVDFLSLDARKLRYRIVSPALVPVGNRLLLRSPAALRFALTWLAYARLPRSAQAALARARTRVRKAGGYAHVMGTFLSSSQIDFVARTIVSENPDFVVFDGIFNVVPRVTEAVRWVLTHEVKHQRAQSFGQRGVAVLPAGFDANIEQAILNDVGNIIAIQWDDAAEFRQLAPQARVVVVPVTVDAPLALHTPPIESRCLFVGSGSYHNVDGIRWFLTECWPQIVSAIPHATLDIFGSVCYSVNDIPAGVTLHGVCDDLSRAYRTANVAIVPLLLGSGLKVKLVEALAYGRPVVTTAVGAQGLANFTPRPFMLAHSAADFAAACVAIITQPNLARELSTAARTCAQRFTPQAAFADFVAATGVDAAERSAPPRICIAVPTFRRLEQLPKLLAGIADQTIGTDAHLEVVVLDNDPDGTAASVVAHIGSAFPYALHYVHVPEPGLASVRNRALACAERFDYIAMIDDDEVPAPQWLAELLRIARVTRADVVVGPVEPILPAGAPAWIYDLRSRETPARPDGGRLRDGWTCNALVAVDTVARSGVTFDPALNFAGGEDQLFFRQLLAHGAEIVYAANAKVAEAIAVDRLSVRFNLRRAYRRGNSLAYCERRMNGGPATFIVRALKATALIALSMLGMPSAFVRGEPALVRHAYGVANGCGMLAALAGEMYLAYGRSD